MVYRIIKLNPYLCVGFQKTLEKYTKAEKKQQQIQKDTHCISLNSINIFRVLFHIGIVYVYVFAPSLMDGVSAAEASLFHIYTEHFDWNSLIPMQCTLHIHTIAHVCVNIISLCFGLLAASCDLNSVLFLYSLFDLKLGKSAAVMSDGSLIFVILCRHMRCYFEFTFDAAHFVPSVRHNFEIIFHFNFLSWFYMIEHDKCPCA